MSFKDIFTLAMHNVRYAKARTSLTMISVCIGISSVVLISALGASGAYVLEQEIAKTGISGITVYSNNENVTLKSSDIEYISEAVYGIKNAQPFIVELGGYQIKGGRGSALLWGVDKNVEDIINLKLLHGRLFNPSDIIQKKRVAVVDSEFALKKYNRENIVSKEIVLNVSDSAQRFEIIGVISSQKDGINQMMGGFIPEFIYIPYKTLGDMRGNNNINQIAIKCTNDMNNEKAGGACVSALARIKRVDKRTFGFENMSKHVNNINGITKLVALLISAIAGISLIVAGVDIINTTVAATIERRREIGIMMATGAGCRDIALCFITESCIVAALGGAIGILIGTFLSFVITNALSMELILNSRNLLVFEIIAIFCGGIFSYFPAYFASRKPPIETLRE